MEQSKSVRVLYEFIDTSSKNEQVFSIYSLMRCEDSLRPLRFKDTYSENDTFSAGCKERVFSDKALSKVTSQL